MKIKLILQILTLLIILCICGCSQTNTENQNSQSQTENTEEEIFEVRFIYNINSYSIQKVFNGRPLKEPTTPTRNNYKFIGWTKDLDTKELYDFDTPVTENFSLHPLYELDENSVKNYISSNIKQSVVQITNKNYNTFLGFETSSKEIKGVGIIFNISNGNCYILTTQQVVEKIDDYEEQEFIVTDYEKNEYKGRIFQSSNKTFIASSKEHNLAVLVISPRGVTAQLKEATLAQSYYSEDIIRVTSQNISPNISFCKYITHSNVNFSTNKIPDLNFAVTHCSGYSSTKTDGCPLFNSDLELIGIRYACKQDNLDKENYITYAIPIDKIKEFLYEYVYN